MKYVILIRPNGNIPFFEELKKMCTHEAMIVFNKLKIEATEMEVVKIGKADYLQFETKDPIAETLIPYIMKLSFYYSMFEVSSDGMLKPVDQVFEQFFGDDLSVRLKYQGKTNESFTRMLINIALFSTNFCKLEEINILDPMCGKGTTLFESLIAGYNAFGAEDNKVAISDLSTYFTRYLQEGKYKHQAMHGKAMSGSDILGEVYEVNIFMTKEDAKKKKSKQLKILRGDTLDSNRIFKKNSIHVIATDLPYGVKHIGKNSGNPERDLEALLDKAFEAWYMLLKKGGALAISWNTYTNKRENLVLLLENNGYEVLNEGDYLNFRHRVSQAINRDIIIAIKR